MDSFKASAFPSWGTQAEICLLVPAKGDPLNQLLYVEVNPYINCLDSMGLIGLELAIECRPIALNFLSEDCPLHE